MIKFIFKLIKKIVLAAIIIYGYNTIAMPLNVIVPINIITILLVTFFNFSGLMALIIFKILLL